MSDPSQVSRQSRIRDVFEEASSLPAGERSAYLERACAGNAELRREVTSLLFEAESVDSPIENLFSEMIWPALKSLSGDASKLEDWLEDRQPADLEQTDPLIGKTISHFEILEPIGRGGMGMVYRAQDRSLDRVVALKFLPPSLSSDTGAKGRFVHEAKAASGLNHPNIATVYEIGETGDHQLFIAMGYYPGVTLKVKIEHGPMTPEEVIAIAIQLATGLKNAHEHGVIHRDIKPGNIMMTAEGTVVLLDFGLAKLSHDIGYTMVGQMMGTIAYMSPEQARGETVDLRSDIWSFGVVLYELLTGRPPFGGSNAQSVIRSILEDDPEPPVGPDGEVPMPLKAILGLCLTKDPEDRYRSAEDLHEDLQRAREGLGPEKRGGLKTWNRRSRRRRWAATVAILFVFTTAAFVVQQDWSGESSDSAGGAGVGRAVQVEGGIDLTASLQLAGGADAAFDSLKSIVRQDPTNAQACSGLGSLYHLSRADYDNALLWYRRAHALEPDNPNVLIRIADVFETIGDLETAAWWTKRALKIAPDSRLSNSLMVLYLLRSGKFGEAIEFFQSHAEDSLDGLNLVLEALLDSGSSEQAMALCQRHCAVFLETSNPDGGQATFAVVDDPFGPDQGKVLKFDPGETIDDAPDGAFGLYSTGSSPHFRKAAYRLPASALIGAANSGQGKSTLYFRVCRPSIDGRPGEGDTNWGLVSGDNSSDHPLFGYPDYSVQGRYQLDGIMDVRDGESFADLTETPLETDVYYELWYVMDHTRNTFDVYLRGGSRYPVQTRVYTGAEYRKKTNNALDHFLIVTQVGNPEKNLETFDPLYWDDIYIDPDRENLGRPDSEWVLIDDFEDGDVSDWLVRLQRDDRVLDSAHAETAYLVARTLSMNGQHDQAGEILNAIETSVESTWRPDSDKNIFLLTRIHALRGERDKTLEGLRKLFGSGGITRFRNAFVEGGDFTKFSDDPQFQDLVWKANALLDLQRARIRGMDARGELAPIPILPYQCQALAGVEFTRIIDGAIVEDTADSYGMAWGDYDNDGYVDVVLANPGKGETIRLYHNDGDGSFSPIDDGILVTDPVGGHSPAWADLDNDGDLDLFVGTGDDSADVLYRNEGSGAFTKVTEGAWVNTPGPESVVAWGDYDNDGFVDLYINRNLEPNLLYHNEGNGTMEPVNVEPNGMTGWANGCLWSDYDDDGDLDLFVAGQERVQFRNDGDGNFSWVSSENGGIPYLFGDLGMTSADYDNDGDLDVLYTTHRQDPSSRLFRNEGPAGFVDMTRAIPYGGSIAADGSAWGDYDNDGFQDLFITNNVGDSLLYHNEGDGSFLRITEEPALSRGKSPGRCAWVDYDNDGDLDLSFIHVTSGRREPSMGLYQNEGNSNHWIVLKLIGTLSNRSAFGAKVRASATMDGQAVTQMRQVGGSGNNQTDLRVHFGLGNAAIIHTLRIEWPSGIVQELNDVAPDQFLTITEDAEPL